MIDELLGIDAGEGALERAAQRVRAARPRRARDRLPAEAGEAGPRPQPRSTQVAGYTNVAYLGDAAHQI